MRLSIYPYECSICCIDGWKDLELLYVSAEQGSYEHLRVFKLTWHRSAGRVGGGFVVDPSAW
jgi:hypothetical protein